MVGAWQGLVGLAWGTVASLCTAVFHFASLYLFVASFLCAVLRSALLHFMVRVLPCFALLRFVLFCSALRCFALFSRSDLHCFALFGYILEFQICYGCIQETTL